MHLQRQDPLIDLSVLAWPDSARLLSELDGLADLSGDGLWQSRPVKSRLLRPDAGEGVPVDLSVITPCYNQGAFLIDAIASVERHAPPNCELIIVNDGSREPRTLEILDALKQAGYFVFDQENAGLSAARNRGISLARGRYILPLDADNRIRDGLIEEAIAVLDADPEVGVVYGDRQDFGIHHLTRQVPEFDLFALLKDNFIDACAVLRKQVWVECDGYEADVCVVADWELWINAAKLGWRFHHLPRVTFDYRVRPESMSTVIDSVDVWAELCKRIRSKHPDFYWTFAVGRIEALKSELESKNAPVAERKSGIHSDTGYSQIYEKDREIQALLDQTHKLNARLGEREAELSRITGSFGWRLLGRYGRIKYRFLLPVYRLFGHAPSATKE
jgi:glycosyltransferase involved in cell wall biosynthesis